MFCGIKLHTKLHDYEAFKTNIGEPLYSKVEKSTGLLDDQSVVNNGWSINTSIESGDWRQYIVEIKNVQRTSLLTNETYTDHYLSLRGSMHKSFTGGENYSKFSWDNLQQELNETTSKLDLSLIDTKITRIEIGVNIEIPYNVATFLKQNIIAYKGKQFNRFSSKNNMLGLVCPQTQSRLKIYSKQHQYGLQSNLVRFEIAFSKMQTLKRFGISKLSDLYDKQKVYALHQLLLNAWNNVLIYDSTVDLKNPKLKPDEILLLHLGRSPYYWDGLKSNRAEYTKNRLAFKKLMSKYGTQLHEKIRDLIKLEWEKLFE